MSLSIKSLVESGTQLWLDSIDPALVVENKAMGATGATSNPIIVADLIKTGRFDEQLAQWSRGDSLSDADIAWKMTDWLVREAQAQFADVFASTHGNDGYVSFEVDPLIEDPQVNLPHAERVAKYIELGTFWHQGHTNRMIKVPATPAGIEAVEELAARGIPLNVTLVFSSRQYQAARDAVWRGAKRRAAPSGGGESGGGESGKGLATFKSVYSIFVSRIDVYTDQQVSQLSTAAQGMVGIVNAKRIWQENQTFWKQHPTPLQQQIVFASTGTKKPADPAWKYVEHLCGSDIQTNPPTTNEKVAESGMLFAKQIDRMPPAEVLAEIDAQVDFAAMEQALMSEGIDKFAKPHQALIRLIAERRSKIAV